MRRDGALGGLSSVFVYCGRKRFPVSALLAAWKAGVWKCACHAAHGEEHEAFILFAGGGLPVGEVKAYCPTCKRLWTEKRSSGVLFTAILPFAPKRHDGLRLDEIIEELEEGEEAR